MSDLLPTPRNSLLDVAWAREVTSFLEIAYGELLDSIGTDLESARQIDFVLVGDYASDLGFLRYGLGYPLDEVRRLFATSASVLQRVFELRGTEPSFPITVLDIDPDLIDTGVEKLVRGIPLRDDGEMDASLTNSRRGLKAMYLALAVGDLSVAVQIANQIGDPPNADYIDPDSEICWPDDQRLAYALRALLLGQLNDVANELSGLSGQSAGYIHQAALLQAIVTEDASNVLAGLERLLRWHKQEALAKANRYKPENTLSLPGIALAFTASTRDIVTVGNIPIDDVYLPVSLPKPST